MNWNKVGALAEVGHEFPEYHLALQSYLKHQGINIVIKRNIKAAASNMDLSQVQHTVKCFKRCHTNFSSFL